jgi:hypothetical protein
MTTRKRMTSYLPEDELRLQMASRPTGRRQQFPLRKRLLRSDIAIDEPIPARPPMRLH